MPKQLPVIDTSTVLCCAPLGSRDFLPSHDAEAVAARLRALSDANRVRIVQELSCCSGHEITTSGAAALLGVSDATASHHLKQLERAGLVSSRREGARAFYGLQMDALQALAGTLSVQCQASCGCAAP